MAVGVAATISGAPSTVHALVRRRDPLDSVRAAASLIDSDDRDLAVALLAGAGVHVVVSSVWGAVLAALLPPCRRASAGAIAGVVIYVIDLGIIARLARLRPIQELPQLPQLADHVAFGWTVGFLLDRWTND